MESADGPQAPRVFAAFVTIVVAAAVLCIRPDDVGSMTGSRQASSPSVTAARMTPDDLERFADAQLSEYVQRSAEPSLAVVVVKDEDVLFRKGYGFEDAPSQRAVDPDVTVFSIASVAKVVTATAAMQLVETGRATLDSDVRAYLCDTSSRRALREPITLRQLLTHTSGLDGPFMRDVVLESADLMPLAVYFGRYPLVHGRNPGSEIRYSNHGMALVGLIIECLTKQSFEDYVRAHVFEPLTMTHSTFVQPVPAPLSAHVATAGSGPIPDLLLPYPAGSLVATVTDMGRFMLAHVAPDVGRRVLTEASIADMHRSQWRAHPHAPGAALGMFETDLGGTKALFHTGARVHFSLMYLVPDRRVGVYLVHSMRQGGPFQHLRTQFIRAFIQRYFDGRDDTTAADRDVADAADRYEGVYQPILFSSTTIERAASMFTDTRVTAHRDGSLTITIPGWPQVHTRAIAETLYRVESEPHRGAWLAFAHARDGTLRMSLSGSTLDPVSFERIGWYQRGYLHAAVLGFVSLLFVGCAVGSLIPALVRAVRRKNRALHPQVVLKGRAAWQVAVLVGVLAGMAPVSVVLLLMIHTGEDNAAQGLRVALSVGLTFLVTGAITGASLVPLTVRAWRNRYWSLGHRLYYTALAIGWLVSIPLLVHYRLLGYWISL